MELQQARREQAGEPADFEAGDQIPVVAHVESGGRLIYTTLTR